MARPISGCSRWRWRNWYEDGRRPQYQTIRCGAGETAPPDAPRPRRAVWTGAEAAGTAVTVLAQPGDNWMIHVAVEQCKPGDILVVGCSTDNTDGMFGDLLATSLMARGVTGLVID